MARDFDLGISGPPLVDLDGLHRVRAGRVGRRARLGAACSLGYAWWAPLAARGRLARHALAAARERRLARPQHRRGSRGAAPRRLRLPPRGRPAGGEGAAAVRAGRLDGRALPRAPAPAASSCSGRRRGCASGRCCGACCSCSPRTSSCSGRWPRRGGDGRAARSAGWSRSRARRSSTSMIAFGGSVVGARRRGRAGGRGAAAARARWRRPARSPPGDARGRGHAGARDPLPRRHASRTRGRARRCSTGFDLTIPAGLVARDRRPERRRQDHAREAAVPALRPAERRDRDRRRRPARARPRRVALAASTAVFQDFIRFELPLRDNVAPGGAPDDVIRAALAEAGAAELADLDTVLARGYEGGTDLSGGQWQRVALARALCAVRLGAGVVLLDEPTAQLDVRGEAEIFERILAATRHATTILISHRFSTVRQADRICVLEHGARGRARHARRADGARRPLPHDVRAAGVALRRRGRRGRRRSMSSTERPAPAGAAARCGARSSAATQAEPLLLAVSFGLALLAALPDALLALWLKLLADGVLGAQPRARDRRGARARRCRRRRPGSCA